MVRSIGFAGAEASAVQGIRRADKMVDRAAASIASASVAANNFGNAASVAISGAGREQAEGGGIPQDLPEAFIDMSRAANLQQANIKVLQTTADMQAELGNLIRTRE
jgi:hypothetical protein